MAYLAFEDTLTGAERWPQSDAFGEIVCPVIFLWKTPGNTAHEDNVSGALPHGAAVRIVEKRRSAGRLWVRIEEPTPGQSGWCLATFLNKFGEKEARIRT